MLRELRIYLTTAVICILLQVSLVYGNLTSHTEALLDALILVLDTDSDGTISDESWTITGLTETTGIISDGGTVTFDESAADPNDCDVRLSATDGVIKIAGVNGVNNEDLNIDVDSVVNSITLTSSTGAGLFLNSTDLLVTGELKGKVEIIGDDETLSAAQCYGSYNFCVDAESISLPVSTAGMRVIIYSRDATVKTVAPASGENIWLNGVDLGDNITMQSPGAIGDFVELICRADGNWYTMNKSGVWIVTP